MTKLAIDHDDRTFSSADWGLIGLVAGIWGSSFMLIAIGLEAMPPSVVTFVRIGLGALTLRALPGERKRLDPRDRPAMIGLSLLWVAIPFTLFPIAEQYVDSAVTGILNGATPIVATVVGVTVLRHRLRRVQAIGVALGFVGMVLTSVPSMSQGTSGSLGVLLVLIATLCYGVSLHIAPPLQRKYGSIEAMTKMLTFAAVWTAPWGVYGLIHTQLVLGPWLAVFALGILGTGVAFVLMAMAVGRIGGTRASMVSYFLPIVALVLGVVIRGEQVSTVAIIGVVTILSGAYLVALGRR